jgi:hypothetical protein
MEAAPACPPARVPAQSLNTFGRQFKATHAQSGDHMASIRDQRRVDSLALAGQSVVFYSIAHAEQRPCAPDPRFRICGLYPSDAHGRAEVGASLGDLTTRGCSIFASPVMRFFLVSRCADEACGAYAQAKIERLIALHEAERKANDATFSANQRAETPKTGAQGLSASRRFAYKDPVDPVDGAAAETVHAADIYPRSAEVRGQQFAAIAVMRDISEDGPERNEPAISVLAAFEREDEAAGWIRDVAGPVLTTVDLYVVRMYEFVPVRFAQDDALKEEYRDGQLDGFMKGRKRAGDETRSLENACAREGMDVPTTEIVSDGTTARTVRRDIAVQEATFEVDGVELALKTILADGAEVALERAEAQRARARAGGDAAGPALPCLDAEMDCDMAAGADADADADAGAGADAAM